MGPHLEDEPPISDLSSRLGESAVANLDLPPPQNDPPVRMHSIPYASFDDDDHEFTNRETFLNPFPNGEFTYYDNLEYDVNRSLDFQFSPDMDTKDEAS